MGFSVFHEDAIFPVRQEGIPINIRNTNHPEHKGTMIVPSASAYISDNIITGIAGKKGFSVVNIEKNHMKKIAKVIKEKRNKYSTNKI